MKPTKHINLIGSVLRGEARLGPSTRALSPRGIMVAVLAMVMVGMAFWSTTAEAGEPAEPVWSADMTVVEYSSASIGAASADLFANVGGSGNLQIDSLWSYKPDRDLRLAFEEGVPNAADYTLRAGDLSLEFPANSSGDGSFEWHDVDVDWEDGQVIHVRIVLTAESDAQPANTPATGVPTISGTAQVGGTLTADTSGIADVDGLTNVSYAYQWIRTGGGTDADIADATDSSYTLTGDDQGNTISLKVTFNDDKGNSEALTSAATAEVGKSEQEPQLLVSNLGVGLAGSGGIQRTLGAARSGFAQAFTTGARTGGYLLGSLGIQVSHFFDGSTVGDHLRVTVNGATSEGGPGAAHCTLTHPSSFSTPGVSAFEAPTGAGSCPPLATETTYFVVIEWVNPSGTDSFALIPQTYPTEESAATEEDPGGAKGWSIADQSHYLSVSSNVRTWTAYDETASFKIVVKGAAATAAVLTAAFENAPTEHDGSTAFNFDLRFSEEVKMGFRKLQNEVLTVTGGSVTSGSRLSTGSNQGWRIRVQPDSDAAVTVVLPATTNCNATGSVCTADERKLSNRTELTVQGPAQVPEPPQNSPATGAPTITGTAQVGETLAADTSGISDADELTSVFYSYQWIADDTAIAGATHSSYTLTSSEQGQTVQVRVTFTDDADNEETLTSAATAAVASEPNNPATGQPAISGTAQVGETLTASTSGIADSDGLDDAVFGYQWLADNSDIAGATASSHTLTSSEQGQTVRVRVSFTDDASNEESLTSEPTEAVEAKPNNPATGAPAISGTAQVGETLTASASGIADADGMDNATFDYRWIADNSDIQDATDPTYILTDADEGKTVRVRVSFTDDANNEETVTSAATAAVAAKPNSPATGQPTISGTAEVGETLTADTSNIADEDGLVNVSYSYQWVAGGSDIGGATGSTHTLTASEQGQTVQVRVTFTDDADNEETLTSAATAAVASEPNNPATGQPAISGTAQVGETLTASTSGIADTDGLDDAVFGYQWLADNSDIAGATDPTYIPKDADEGKTIQVRVSFTDDRGNDETQTSAATAAVAGAPADPLTASLENTPESHNGTDAFTFELRFSEEVKLSYKTLRDQSFTVSGGTVKKAKRLEQGSNIHWLITVEPDSDADVTVVLPATTDCDDPGAICTRDGGRPLSSPLELTVRGPGQ